MKAIVAVLLFALLALADARTVLKNKSTAKATSTATADDGSYAASDAHAKAKDGSDAVAIADSKATDDSIALSTADATAVDGSKAKAAATAVADDESAAVADADAFADYWSFSKAEALAKADNEGYADADALAKAVNEAEAVSEAKAIADGGEAEADSVAKADGGYATSTAKAVAEGDPKYKVYYKPKYYVDPDVDVDGDKKGYFPYYFDPLYYHYGYGYAEEDDDDKYYYPYHGYYIPKVDAVDKDVDDVTIVKFVDPALLKYYAHKVYDFGCYEGKFYRCSYDDSCGKCPYGHFCGETSKTVCKDVKVWVKKCDPKAVEPVKKCKPVLTPCGKGFCKYNEKCATDYFWCGEKWCEPKYTCVAVAEPKKCTFVIVTDDYGFEKKVEKCVEYKEEACAAGKAPCPIGFECSTDPCTYVEETVKTCGEEKVPVCLAFDIPTYKDLFKPCGPGFCHPGYKCEAFEHKTCKPLVDPTKVVVLPVHHYVEDVKPVDPVVHVYPVDDDDDDDYVDDKKDYEHYYIPYPDPKGESKATATSTSVAKGDESYTNVDVYATGDASASGSADASTDKSSAYTKAKAAKGIDAKVWTGTTAEDGGKAKAEGSATYEDD